MKRSKQNKKGRARGNLWLDILILIVAFVGSAGASYYYLRGMFAFESSFIADIEARQALSSKKDIKKGDRRLYATGNGDSGINDGTVYRKDTMLVVAEDIIRKSLKTYNVRLLDLYMDRSGTVYMDFGSEIVKNFKGGADEELDLIAGIYRGIKSAVPGFRSLKILIQGREAESLGGHIDISMPIGEEIAKNI